MRLADLRGDAEVEGTIEASGWAKNVARAVALLRCVFCGLWSLWSLVSGLWSLISLVSGRVAVWSLVLSAPRSSLVWCAARSNSSCHFPPH